MNLLVPVVSILVPLPQINGLFLPDIMPALIVETMTVVRNLGYRYFWADR